MWSGAEEERTAGRAGRLVDHWTEVDGMRLYARRSVDPVPPGRPPLVLVHGHGVSSRYLVPTARLLARDYRVLAPDLPGTGRSDRPDRILSLSELADVLAAWMDALGLERAALLGNSYGCEIAVELALRHPDRVACGVLQGPAPDPDARTAPRQILRLLRDAPRERTALLPIVLADYWRFGPRRLWKNLQSNVLRERIEEKLARVRAPMLVVRGDRDPLVPRSWAERATALLPHGRLVVVPGGSHALVFSHARELSRIVRVFLSDPDGLAGARAEEKAARAVRRRSDPEHPGATPPPIRPAGAV